LLDDLWLCRESLNRLLAAAGIPLGDVVDILLKNAHL
jgi:hypothetical protein